MEVILCFKVFKYNHGFINGSGKEICDNSQDELSELDKLTIENMKLKEKIQLLQNDNIFLQEENKSL